MNNESYLNIQVIEVRPLDNYKLWCRLSTGETKIWDVSPYLELPIFQPLKNISMFNNVIIDCGGLRWDEIDLDVGVSGIVVDGVNCNDLYQE